MCVCVCVCVSLSPSPLSHALFPPILFRTLQRLPSDLLGALDLDYLLSPTQNPQNPPQPTTTSIPFLVVDTPPRHTQTQALLRENILTFQRVYSGSGLSPERIIAKALVDSVLHSAQKRLAPPIFTFGAGAHTGPDLNTKHAFLNVNDGVDGVMEWRESKRSSLSSIRGMKDGARASASGMSMDSEGYGSASTDCSDMPRNEGRKISFHIGKEPVTVSMDTQEKKEEEVVDEEELRVVAKKLVMKILHMACKEVESLNRRSSIEYLVASTKRMRIEESPSPPPPALFNIAEEQDGVDPSNENTRPNPFSELRSGPSERSPTPEHLLRRKLGKKRGRSGSHEVSALREFIETSRRSKVIRKIINFKERIMGGVQQPSSGRGSSVKSPTRSNDDSSSQSGDEATSYTSLISNMSRMSIGPPQLESDTESEATSINDESFTILSAITVSEDPLAGLRDESTSSSTSKRFPFQDIHHHTSGHQKSNHLGLAGGGGGGGSATDSPLHVTSSAHNTPSPLATQYSSTNTPQISSSNSDNTCNDAQDSVVSNMDLYVIIHSRPSLGKCQKFLCNNTNEVNLMYHCWMYPNVPFDPGMSLSGKLEMGVFEPSFVEPVHLDLQDAGAAFYYLEERYVKK